MNMELLQLQKEIREIRQQNFQGQNDIRYIPLNIISNNLYINNNSLNRSSTNSNFTKNNNNIYNSYILGREALKKRQLEQKRKTPFGKLPIRKGMFSYKTTLNNNHINHNINLYRNNSQKVFEMPKPNYNDNNYKINTNSLLAAELKLNLDDNYNEESKINNDQNEGMGNKVLSISSLDLNKYKVNKTNIINQKKNVVTPNFQGYNYINNMINMNNNNILNNPNMNYNNFIENKKQILNNNSEIIELKNNSSEIFEKKKKKVKIIADHFKNNPKNEKESRRMIIEYIKILNKKEYKYKKVYTPEDISTTLEKNNISKKVLNKEYSPEEFNSMNIFNDSSSKANFNNNDNIKSKKSLLNNSFGYENTTNSKGNSNIKSKKKSLITPIKKNINNFLNKMDDIKKDKINFISFLAIPRIMNLYFKEEKYKFIIVVCPNNICFKDAIESYIFKFLDINKKQYVGGFDLIKIRICSKIQNKPNNFYIETFDGKTNRNYEFQTKSSNIADNYVKAINYLTQLVKCKIYNFKNTYKEVNK